ncbi:hypothetical protein SHL15_0047 [Streptomyces hygroscopicus subsp. limoneus]|nr:hypothetical protein SHL15_0047 [Streptomyces hygroscopicus subsp. limoneus]
MHRLRPGGLLVSDNVLPGSRVLDPAYQENHHLAMRRLNDLVAADERVDSVIPPVRDGLTTTGAADGHPAGSFPPSETSLSHGMRVCHAMWLARIDHTIAQLVQRQAEQELGRRAKPAPPDSIVERSLRSIPAE